MPQGPCLGTVLYTAYASTLPEAVDSNGISITRYTDNHGFYNKFSTNGVSFAEQRFWDGLCPRQSHWLNGVQPIKIKTSKTEMLLNFFTILSKVYFHKLCESRSRWDNTTQSYFRNNISSVNTSYRYLQARLWKQSICGDTKDIYMNKLQSIQKAAAKLIQIRQKFDSATECLSQLHWFPVECRIKYKTLCFVLKSLHGTAPASLSSMF